jgi:hypothetical protein
VTWIIRPEKPYIIKPQSPLQKKKKILKDKIERKKSITQKDLN